jgi:hypothetical protein
MHKKTTDMILKIHTLNTIDKNGASTRAIQKLSSPATTNSPIDNQRELQLGKMQAVASAVKHLHNDNETRKTAQGS